MRRPLWTGATPESILVNWPRLKDTLLARDEDWQVWTTWYDDRLRGEGHPKSHPLIEELELKRVLIPDVDWEKEARHVNALIAARKTVAAAVIDSEHGHDSFLLPLPRYVDVLYAFLDRLYTQLSA